MRYTRRTTTETKVIRGLILTFLFGVFYFIFSDRVATRPLISNIGREPIRPERYPAKFEIPLPRGRPVSIPKIQHAPPVETPKEKAARKAKLEEIRDHYMHAWNGYKAEAWAQDELRPITGGYKTPFCGWAASLVDALDTLWIMELYDEFDLAIAEVEKIDFTGTEGCNINLFETTIRHLGGLLAAYDISGQQKKYNILLEKAVELGEILYTAFDTPNRMPTPHYTWSATDNSTHNHLSSSSIVLAVLGTLTLEFTRLSQVTGDPKYYSAVQTTMDELEKWQMETSIPGMWPAMVDATKMNGDRAVGSPFEGSSEIYTLGSLADSAYEYLGKEYLILGGLAPQYRKMYEKFIEPAKEHLFFRPMTVGEEDILIAGLVDMIPGGEPKLSPTLEHLTCFTGGMVAMAGKMFNRPEDVEVGRKLADGCVWAYKNTLSGIMPETFNAVPCKSKDTCPWDMQAWFKAVQPDSDEETVRTIIKDNRLSPGFASVRDTRYLLRPEAIESVFIMYRISADSYWANAGWDMFKSIAAHTKTRIAHSALDDVTLPSPRRVDEMESFWFAETLKYFYLLYSDWDVVDLDTYVLNTEAHPLLRPK